MKRAVKSETWQSRPPANEGWSLDLFFLPSSLVPLRALLFSGAQIFSRQASSRLDIDIGYTDGVNQQGKKNEDDREDSRRGSPAKRLGEFLCENGTITREELEEALEIQKQTGRKLGAILVDMGLLSEEALCEELSHRLDIPYFDLRSYFVDPKVVQIIPEHLCERYRLIALKKSKGKLTVAMINPFDDMALEDLEILTGLQIRPVLATPSAISKALAHAYGAIDYAQSLIASLKTSGHRLDLQSRLYELLDQQGDDEDNKVEGKDDKDEK